MRWHIDELHEVVVSTEVYGMCEVVSGYGLPDKAIGMFALSFEGVFDTCISNMFEVYGAPESLGLWHPCNPVGNPHTKTGCLCMNGE